MHKEKAEDAPNVMTGTFCTQIQPVDILFDSNVMHSFISAKLVETLRLVLTRKSSLLSVILPDGNVVRCEELYDCLLYTSPSPRDGLLSRMPSSA